MRISPFIAAFCIFITGFLSASFGIEVRHARNFGIERGDGYTIVTVSHAYKGAGDRVFKYVLLSRGQALPEGVEDAMVVHVPVKRVVALSTTFLSPIDMLDEVDSLVGIGSFKYTNTQSIRKKIERNELVEVGSESSKNVELMVSLDPDLVFTNAIGNPDHDIHPVLNQMEIPCGLTAAYMEETLLGRAEWIKFVAAFYDKLDLADEIFDQIEARYVGLVELTKTVTNRPTVFTNAPWGNVWYMPSGLSYTAWALKDAGADYLWKDSHSDGSLPLDFETVYEQALDADYWINTGYLDTLEAVHGNDVRYGDFKSVQSGQIYSETNRLNGIGGNDIWERGFTHPDEILADMIKIFHPELLPEHELVYYRQVR